MLIALGLIIVGVLGMVAGGAFLTYCLLNEEDEEEESSSKPGDSGGDGQVVDSGAEEKFIYRDFGRPDFLPAVDAGRVLDTEPESDDSSAEPIGKPESEPIGVADERSGSDIEPEPTESESSNFAWDKAPVDDEEGYMVRLRQRLEDVVHRSLDDDDTPGFLRTPHRRFQERAHRLGVVHRSLDEELIEGFLEPPTGIESELASEPEPAVGNPDRRVGTLILFALPDSGVDHSSQAHVDEPEPIESDDPEPEPTESVIEEPELADELASVIVDPELIESAESVIIEPEPIESAEPELDYPDDSDQELDYPDDSEPDESEPISAATGCALLSEPVQAPVPPSDFDPNDLAP